MLTVNELVRRSGAPIHVVGCYKRIGLIWSAIQQEQSVLSSTGLAQTRHE
ncbi:MAG: hypothetical protein OQL16_04545 [Gammaproteobacteria bacterium]|nr:hypothetical protein [Gammaproteobacteria bacterium]